MNWKTAIRILTQNSTEQMKTVSTWDISENLGERLNGQTIQWTVISNIKDVQQLIKYRQKHSSINMYLIIL